MAAYNYLVVGAGLFGAVFAHEAHQAGKNVMVIDKRGHIGGNVFTANVDGIPVHRYGAHIFHTDDQEVWNYVRSFASFNRFTNAPLARYRDELYHLPFNMNTFYQMWGITKPEEARAIIAAQQEEITGEPKNLEEQAISLVGRDVYEKLVKGYTEKQWGCRCDQLPAFIIKRLPLRFTYDNNYFNDRYQGIPIGGYTPMIEKMLEEISVQLNTDYEQVRNLHLAKKTIYTGPIDEYFRYCFGPLKYRSLSFKTIDLKNTQNYQGNAVINYTEGDIPYTRVIEHKHFSYDQPEIIHLNHSVVTWEYPMAWQKGSEPYYPVNDEKNNALYERYRALAEKEENTVFGGRLGQYRYFDMDDTVRAALDCAKQELSQD